jgi:spore germination protein GerM
VTRTRIAIGSIFAGIAGVLVWLLFFALPRWYGPGAPKTAPTRAASPAAAADSQPARKIKAHVFYVAEDGTHLTGIEQDISYAEPAVEQAREILKAQLAPPAAPFVSAIPVGTALRALFLTAKGEAFVDVSSDIVSAHPGGSLNERLTIYTIVEALTFNLPKITAVQLLVDGKEVETLAGHIDLRRPLARLPQLTIGP